MKYFLLYTVCVLSGCFFITSVGAHDVSNNTDGVLSFEQKQSLESRLHQFFDRVDSFEIEKQQRVYITLDEKINNLVGKYNLGTPEHSILSIISDIIIHKLDTKIILSNAEILDHVLYGKSHQHYIEEPIIEVVPDVLEQPEVVVRNDLNTTNLNEYEKDILAGTPLPIVSVKIRADLEPIDTETVAFVFNQNLDNIGLGGNLYHNGILVATATSTDVDGDMLIFDNIVNLIVPEKTSYLQLELVTSSIGRDRIGAFKNDISVISVALRDNTGTITGDQTADKVYRESSRAFSIVPVRLTVATLSEFGHNKNTAQLHISYDAGENNQNGAGLQPEIYNLDILVSSFNSSGTISVFNSAGDVIGSTNVTTSGRITIPLISDSISSRGEAYRIETTAEANFYLPQDGIKYSAGTYNLETNLGKQIFLGQY